jgi:hypothetical protein
MNECVCYSMLSVTMPSHDPVFLPVYASVLSMGVCVRARVACSSLANHSMPPLPQGGAHCAPRHYLDHAPIYFVLAPHFSIEAAYLKYVFDVD